MVTKSKLYLFALLITLGSTSCIAAIAGGSIIGSAVFQGATLKAPRPFPIDQTWKASLRALDSLKISVTKRSHDADSALIKGITALDNSVKISMNSLDVNTTRISIRVGVFGDEKISREILRRIDRNLELLRHEGVRTNSSNSFY